jgi:uncharacterized protein YndB with AHSA1/START domain
MKLIDLTVERDVPATPAEIYDVWLDPKSPGSPWFGPARVLLDARVDGLFYHAVEHEGRTWPHYGRFVTLDRPRQIAHTWVSESTLGKESIVTLTFAPSATGGTTVTLRHTGVPDDTLGRQHEQGWTWVLAMLAERFGAKPAK